jgi:ribosomal-protein-alanine N-acetyltransferase
MTSATVTIRPIGWNDAESLQETLDDPAVYLPCGLRDSTGEFDISEFVKNRIAGWESGAAYSFVVLASDKLVGGCTLHMARGNRQRAEIGFWIQRVFWGKSIATRAARQMVTFGFERLSLRSIEGRCVAENIAAARVLMKNGFHFQHQFRCYSAYLSSSTTLNSFRILRDERFATRPVPLGHPRWLETA